MALPALLGIAGNIIGGIFDIVDKTVEDKDKAAEIKAGLQTQVLQMLNKELDTAGNIIVAEAKGDSWIQRNWRPITMLVFVGLVVAKWLGFTAPGVSEEIELALLDIIKVGLGGYVVGRSVEKGIKVWKEK
jgi:hypothetical protein